MSDLKNILAKEFSDKEYAHSYMHAHLLERLAAQIFSLRSTRKLSQHDLAKLSGIPQGKLSKLECAEVDSFTLSTLLKLGKALDVAVNVGFEPFSTLVRKVEKSSHADLAVQSRADDLKVFTSVNKFLNDTVGQVTTPVVTYNNDITSTVTGEVKSVGKLPSVEV